MCSAGDRVTVTYTGTLGAGRFGWERWFPVEAGRIRKTGRFSPSRFLVIPSECRYWWYWMASARWSGDDGLSPVQIRNGPGHREDAVMGAGRKPHAVKSLRHQGASPASSRAQNSCDLIRRHLSVAGDAGALEPGRPGWPGPDPPAPFYGRRGLRCLLAAHGLIFRHGNDHVKVNATPAGGRRSSPHTRATSRPNRCTGREGWPPPSAPAGVHGAHQLEAAGQMGVPLARATVTSPSSRGWRRASRTSR